MKGNMVNDYCIPDSAALHPGYAGCPYYCGTDDSAKKHAALLAIPEMTRRPRGHGVPTLLTFFYGVTYVPFDTDNYDFAKGT